MANTSMSAVQERSGTLFLLFALFTTPLFGLFSYNSTYGYDQVEYLVIGRGLNEGYPLFELAPSKGPGIYLFVAALNRLGVTFDHPSLSVVIALVYLMLVTTSYFTARRVFGGVAALLTAVLVGAITLFMALNFLQPTGFVVVPALGAFILLLGNLDRPRFGVSVLVGVLLGLSFLFKSVGAFYGVGMGVFLLINGIQTRQLPRNFLILVSIGVGVISTLGLAFAYFAATGRAAACYEWTFHFPLFEYPSNTVEFQSLYEKLGWFHLLLPASLLFSLHGSRRKAIYGNRGVQLALCMGGISYLALLKGQATHYCYPGGVFFCMFIAAVASAWLEGSRLALRHLVGIVVGCVALVGLMVGATFLHFPDRGNPFLRFFTLKDYSEERELAQFIKDNCPPGSKALFFSGAQRLYWTSHRYPAVPFVNLNVQTAYLLRKDPGYFRRALDNPDLAIVEFDRREFGKIRESEQFKAEEFSAMIDEFEFHLRERFVPIEGAPQDRIFWRRK